MKRRTLAFCCAAGALLLLAAGCAANRRYAWGGYDSALYRHYKNPQDKEAYLERLANIVKNAEVENRVPPGLYAELGYALYEAGKTGEAITHFEKEMTIWPESGVLMKKMILNAKRRQDGPGNSPAPAVADPKEAAGQEVSK